MPACSHRPCERIDARGDHRTGVYKYATALPAARDAKAMRCHCCRAVWQRCGVLPRKGTLAQRSLTRRGRIGQD
eukprot:4637225-Alexandrium_andersonii.AAC.1